MSIDDLKELFEEEEKDYGLWALLILWEIFTSDKNTKATINLYFGGDK